MCNVAVVHDSGQILDKGRQGVRARYDEELPPFMSIVQTNAQHGPSGVFRGLGGFKGSTAYLSPNPAG